MTFFLEELILFPNVSIDTEFLVEMVGYVKNKLSLKFLHLNLSWESGLVNRRFTREMTKELFLLLILWYLKYFNAISDIKIYDLYFGYYSK